MSTTNRISTEAIKAADKLLEITDRKDALTIIEQMWKSYLSDDATGMDSGEHRLLVYEVYKNLRLLIKHI